MVILSEYTCALYCLVLESVALAVVLLLGGKPVILALSVRIVASGGAAAVAPLRGCRPDRLLIMAFLIGFASEDERLEMSRGASPKGLRFVEDDMMQWKKCLLIKRRYNR
jgi:hypothetical protein